MRFVRTQALKNAVGAVQEALREEVDAYGVKLQPSTFSYEQIEWAVIGMMSALEQGPVSPADLIFVGVDGMRFPSLESAEKRAKAG